MKIKRVSIEKILIYFLFIIYTLPRYSDSFFSRIHIILAGLRIALIPVLILLALKENKKISKLTLILGIYLFWLLFSTFLNGRSILYVIRIYFPNIGILLISEILLNEENRSKFLCFASKYFGVLIGVNLFFMIIGYILGNSEGKLLGTYLLGQDNRFILYIIPSLICHYFSDEKNNGKIIINYIISLSSLILCWSASAIVVCLLLGIFYILEAIFKKDKKIYAKLLFYIIIILNIAIVFFNVQDNFRFFIEEVLHKSMTLSYRTIIWNRVINYINQYNKFVYGFGFFNPSYLFEDIYDGIIVNHIHNLMLNLIFFGGLIGLAIYYIFLNVIVKNISRVSKQLNGKFLIICFFAILLLMTFDTFEFFPLYYFTLYLIDTIGKDKTKINMKGEN